VIKSKYNIFFPKKKKICIWRSSRIATLYVFQLNVVQSYTNITRKRKLIIHIWNKLLGI